MEKEIKITSNDWFKEVLSYDRGEPAKFLGDEESFKKVPSYYKR